MGVKTCDRDLQEDTFFSFFCARVDLRFQVAGDAFAIGCFIFLGYFQGWFLMGFGEGCLYEKFSNPWYKYTGNIMPNNCLNIRVTNYQSIIFDIFKDKFTPGI